jgi:hypothetical protein
MWEIQPNGEWQKEDTWDDTMSEEEIQRKKKQMALLETLKMSKSIIWSRKPPPGTLNRTTGRG